VIAGVCRAELDQQHGPLVTQLTPACRDALDPALRLAPAEA
jgi:hypothetical protein